MNFINIIVIILDIIFDFKLVACYQASNASWDFITGFIILLAAITFMGITNIFFHFLFQSTTFMSEIHTFSNWAFFIIWWIFYKWALDRTLITYCTIFNAKNTVFTIKLIYNFIFLYLVFVNVFDWHIFKNTFFMKYFLAFLVAAFYFLNLLVFYLFFT